MDFDGIADRWASGAALSAPAILSTVLNFDAGQLASLRRSVARHSGLNYAVEVIDGFSAFQEARQRLEEARIASADMARHAKTMLANNEQSNAMAHASADRASEAQRAADKALRGANSSREKIDAAVLLELADHAALQARDTAEAADRLTTALTNLVRASQPPVPDGFELSPSQG